MISSNRVDNELTDSSGVSLNPIFLSFERRGSLNNRVLWKAEHLVEMAIKGDKVFLY
jgi:hypothetical protein